MELAKKMLKKEYERSKMSWCFSVATTARSWDFDLGIGLLSLDFGIKQKQLKETTNQMAAPFKQVGKINTRLSEAMSLLIGAINMT